MISEKKTKSIITTITSFKILRKNFKLDSKPTFFRKEVSSTNQTILLQCNNCNQEEITKETKLRQSNLILLHKFVSINKNKNKLIFINILVIRSNIKDELWSEN